MTEIQDSHLSSIVDGHTACGLLGSLRPTYSVLIVTAVIFISILPVLAVPHLPLVDYPNHLARYFIHKNLATSPILQRFYEYHWSFLPNLAQDLLVMPLADLFPIELAARIATIFALILIALGTILVDFRLNDKQWGLSLFAGIFLYGGAFRMGFINDVTGVGFALVAFSVWLKYRGAMAGRLFVPFVMLGVFLVLMHLYAFGLYAVCVGGYEATVLCEEWRAGTFDRRYVKSLGANIGCLVLPLITLGLSQASEGIVLIQWSTLQWKAEALASPIFFSQPFVELPMLIIVGGLVLAGLATRTLSVRRRMIFPILAFAVLFAAMPHILMGSSYADYRLPSGAIFFFLASLRLEQLAIKRTMAIFFVMIVLLALRIISLLAEWIPEQPIIAEYDHAFALIPPGSKVLVLLGSTGSTSRDRRPPLEHVPVFFAATHEDFVPYIFADVDFSSSRGARRAVPLRDVPLRLKPAYRSFSHIFQPDPEWARDMGQYDDVLTIRNPRYTIPAGIEIHELGQGMTWKLYRVEHVTTGAGESSK